MFQPIEEKVAERELINSFAKKINAKVLKLQEDVDDSKTDGIIEHNGKKISVEARRKGYPNHSGHTLSFKNGWKTKFLVSGGGIFLNELTIKNHKDEGFIFLVDIKGFAPKACFINTSRINQLLMQPHRTMKSTNSKVLQSVKTVPLYWFKEF